MPFAVFHFGLEAKRMILALALAIIRHGVLQRLMVWEIMSEGNGDIVDRGVHSQMVIYVKILVQHQIALKVF